MYINQVEFACSLIYMLLRIKYNVHVHVLVLFSGIVCTCS